MCGTTAPPTDQMGSTRADDLRSAPMASERPALPHLARQHSRSSSQLATLGALSFSIVPPLSPGRRTSGNQSPRYSVDGLRGYESPNRHGSLSRTTSPERNSSSLLSSPNRRGDFEPLSEQSESSPEVEREGFDVQHVGTMLGPPAMSLSIETLVADPASATSATDDSPPSLAILIQQKRRQASAPYLASARSASLFSPGAGFAISSASSAGTGASGWAGSWGAAGGAGGEEDLRARSRRASRVGTVSGLSLRPLATFSSEEREQENLGMVMTPTTEEWRQLGGRLSELADIRARDEERIVPAFPPGEQVADASGTGHSSLSTSSSSSSIDMNSLSLASSRVSLGKGMSFEFPRVSSTSPAPLLPEAELPKVLLAAHTVGPPPSTPEKFSIPSSFSYQSSRTGFTSHSHSTSLSYDPESLPVTSGSAGGPSPHYTDPLPSIATFAPTHNRSQQSESSFLLPPHLRPSLTRGSLSSTTGKPGSPSSSVSLIHHPSPFNRNLSSTSSLDSPLPTPPPIELPLLPIDLDDETHYVQHGPVDPRRYSAYSGFRSIDDFVVEGQAGKGAYGTVRKARERGADGLPQGVRMPACMCDADPLAAGAYHQVRDQTAHSRRLLEEAQDPRTHPD